MFNKRIQERVDNNLGIIRPGGANGQYRNAKLDKIDKYLSSTQYDDKMDWIEAQSLDEYVPIRQRKPTIIYPLPAVIVDRLGSKIAGEETFPKFTIEEDEETSYLISLIIKHTMFKSKMLETIKTTVAFGSCFVRFKLILGKLIIEKYNPKYCYPVFNEANELTKVEIKYIFEDWEDVDNKGKPKKKWFKLEVTENYDVIYNTPEALNTTEPTFEELEKVEHGLGFVQGEWFRTTENQHEIDGPGIVAPIMPFVDSLNYNLSQSDKAVSYALDPQAVFSGMSEDEIEDLIKSSSKGWALGREGSAQFLEIGGSGIQRAQESRDSLDTKVQDITRIIMLNPEKIVGSAQSAKAMEVLHGPMIDLINELKPYFEKSMVNLLLKMLMSLIIYNKRGEELFIQMPAQYMPKATDISTKWGDIFPKTMLDLQQKVQTVVSAANANIISRETALKMLAKDFNVEDIELELQKVNTQPKLSMGWGF